MSGKTELERVLEKHRDKRFTLIEPGGNYGDRLIYDGLEKKLDRIGIKYESFNYIDVLRGSYRYKFAKGLNLTLDNINTTPFRELPLEEPEIVLIHGGGNFGDLWGSSMDIFKFVTQVYDSTPIIVGPQTYWLNQTDFGELLNGKSQMIKIFCREKYSYNILQSFSYADNVSLNLSPDTALYLEEDDLQQYVDDGLQMVPNGTYELIAFRTDKESVVASDKVQKLKMECENPIIQDISLKSEIAFEEFVSLTKFADTVYTDRLHVSVLSSILGTDVQMYENRYYKNRGVYKYSLSEIETVRFNDAV